ncbi:hypothetical protein [Sedimentisphaera salicampi]|uniref:Uncharacterized protein n=1 Tax=Sedimentisphaera salicampi TaxID=1941349 RepID=A0A1W6LPB2_9BACT|nr:hypothetical protein [Sedimentisphaera salicampi]ARN57586.1 hypothetical protein STSP1_02001 [Sedimentisphaera salicampi]OXU14333.1 hypothetical protein SMSP1_01916 [Sedimentisphaera salicampi]
MFGDYFLSLCDPPWVLGIVFSEKILIILAVLNLPVYFFLGWVIFDDWEGFVDSVKYIVTSDWISALRGEYYDDAWGEIKFLYFLATCAAAVFGEYLLIEKYFLAN